jgi:hypothetical protein
LAKCHQKSQTSGRVAEETRESSYLKISSVTGARFPVFDVSGAGQSHKRATRQRRWLAEGDIGHFARFSLEREVLSERIIRISLPHQDPAKVRMTGETDSHHVVHFALVPIGSGPEVGDRRRLQMILGNSGFQPEVNVRLQGVKFIDDLEPRLVTEVIDTGEVGKKIKPELLFGELTGFLNLAEREFKSRLTAKICSLNDLKLLLELGGGFLAAHEKTSSSSFF